MAKKEIFILLSLGFLVFTVIFIRFCLLVGIKINNTILPTAFGVFNVIASIIFSLKSIKPQTRKLAYTALILFDIFMVFNLGLSILFSKTYDTSWDGQGYHQTGIIALANGWNPYYKSAIQLKQKLPSQVFAEGYPSAIWEIQASIYSLIGRINAAKVLNIYILIIAFITSYIYLSTIRLSKTISLLLSLLLVAHPTYLNQLLTFMQDGVSYQLVLISIFALLASLTAKNSSWSIVVFCLSILLLINTKYSMLPIALLLAFIFIIFYINQLMNKEFLINTNIKIIMAGLGIVSAFIIYLPFVRNIVFHGSMFYPTNIPDLMGSVKYNNVPSNLKDDNKIKLLFYGIFSRSQFADSGDPANSSNIAQLKIPFTFSINEVMDNVSLYNNRVGALGPLFSGIFISSFLLLFYTSFKTEKRKDRYVIYSIYFIITTLIILSLLTPTPNLHRYNAYLFLIPFAVVVPILRFFKNRNIQILSFFIISLLSLNIIFLTYGEIVYNYTLQNKVNNQLQTLKSTNGKYLISAQNFYSNYILLTENNIPFLITDYLNCTSKKEVLISSSNTTYFCKY